MHLTLHTLPPAPKRAEYAAPAMKPISHRLLKHGSPAAAADFQRLLKQQPASVAQPAASSPTTTGPFSAGPFSAGLPAVLAMPPVVAPAATGLPAVIAALPN